MQKRAKTARRRLSFYCALAALLLALAADSSWVTLEVGFQCSDEAQVSIERNGPTGTFAEGSSPSDGLG